LSASLAIEVLAVSQLSYQFSDYWNDCVFPASVRKAFLLSIIAIAPSVGRGRQSD